MSNVDIISAADGSQPPDCTLPIKCERQEAITKTGTQDKSERMQNLGPVPNCDGVIAPQDGAIGSRNVKCTGAAKFWFPSYFKQQSLDR